jgi:hypothetical protein
MKKQWTLGELIRAVASVPASYPVVFKDGKAFGDIGAYRGDHEALAISVRGKNTVTTAEEVLVHLARVLDTEVGESECLMTGDTPIWRSQYGEMEQKALVGVDVKHFEGKTAVILKTKKREMDY